MSTRKKIYKKKGNVIKDLTQKLLKILNQSPNNSFNYRQISSKLEMCSFSPRITINEPFLN